jgi:GntR family transcriptional regulator / MocR family aminotransferase
MVRSISVAETWAKSLDLYLDLTGARIRSALESALRDAIRDGRLHPGTRLPSSRALAADLGVARNTVAEVYSQLVAAGWLAAQTGAGTSVAARPATPAASTAGTEAAQQLRYNLRPGVPDVSSFPRREWLAAARRALAAAPDHLLGYADPRGLPELRTALAEYLARARGVVTHPDRIVICSGYAAGLAVVARALRATGARTMAVEEYGQQQHRDIVTAQGLELRLLRIDDRGARVGDADAVVLTPAHQFPLGMTLDPRRRRAFTERTPIVIEDDYDGEFRYDRQPVGAMQALAPDRVLYAGTASKSLAPGVRLAWLVVPPRLADAVTAALDGGPSVIDQLTLAEFLRCGEYDRHIRRTRLAYRRRRDRLVTALDGLGLELTGISAGLHAVVHLRTARLSRVLSSARAHGLALDGLDTYAALADPDRSGLVIGYGRPPEHAYTTALARLCAVLAA